MAGNTAKAPNKRAPKKKSEAVKAVAETFVEEVQETFEEEIVEEKRVYDLHDYVTVRNGFHGKLVYKSKHTGEMFVWDEFGDEQEMEVKELKDAKSTCKKLYIYNWFQLHDKDKQLLKRLGVAHYYNKSLPIDDFDEIFELDPEALKARIAELSDGMKANVTYRARHLINDGDIDSRKTVKALEEALGIKFFDED